LLPIVLSSALFALAHVGHGPDPIPLFFLALILGYIYQRTHRIVPCIVAHMLFNSLAMLVLWQMIFVNAK
jgi:membrane protease YdiL (CAAX protease family)